ncbi:MAG: response regulator transcription factor [Thermoanaerobaculia bacterium]
MRVLLLDSERWRDLGIARALDRAQGINPIIERELGDQTWSKSGADVVLVSESSVRTDLRRSLPAIRRKFPRARILVHGDECDPSTIARLVAQGADGYFSLSLGEEKLVKAIRDVARGSVWVPGAAVTSMVKALRHGSGLTAQLTDVESTLLRMLDQGLSNKEMAAQTGVAEITVKTRLARLYRRFGVNTRVQLLSYAVRNGLIPRH